MGYDSNCSFEIGVSDIGEQQIYNILKYHTVGSGGNDLRLEEAYWRDLRGRKQIYILKIQTLTLWSLTTHIGVVPHR